MVSYLIVVSCGVCVFDELCILLSCVGTYWQALCIVTYLLICLSVFNYVDA